MYFNKKKKTTFKEIESKETIIYTEQHWMA